MTTPAKPYQYQGAGRTLSDAEAAARLARNGATPPAVGRPPVKATKGAVRVDGFPERSKYPFALIAGDGGVWKLDPAAFSVKPTGIKQAATKWAQSHRLKVKVVVDDGQVYVQFTKADP